MPIQRKLKVLALSVALGLMSMPSAQAATVKDQSYPVWVMTGNSNAAYTGCCLYWMLLTLDAAYTV
jgi:hypothetical protein